MDKELLLSIILLILLGAFIYGQYVHAYMKDFQKDINTLSQENHKLKDQVSYMENDLRQLKQEKKSDNKY